MENYEKCHFTSNDDPETYDRDKATSVTGAEKGSLRAEETQESSLTGGVNLYQTSAVPYHPELQEVSQKNKPDKTLVNAIFYCLLGGIILLTVLIGIILHKMDLTDQRLTESLHKIDSLEQALDMRDSVYQEKFGKILDDLEKTDDKINGLRLPPQPEVSEMEDYAQQESADPGKLDHGWLGVTVFDVDETALTEGLPQGAYIDGILDKGAADKAGLFSYDVITGFNGSPITCVSDLLGAIEHTMPGDKVKLDIIRLDEEEPKSLTVEVTMMENPNTEKN